MGSRRSATAPAGVSARQILSGAGGALDCGARVLGRFQAPHRRLPSAVRGTARQPLTERGGALCATRHGIADIVPSVESVIDRLQSAAYELVLDGESYRRRQRPTPARPADPDAPPTPRQARRRRRT